MRFLDRGGRAWGVPFAPFRSAGVLAAQRRFAAIEPPTNAPRGLFASSAAEHSEMRAAPGHAVDEAGRRDMTVDEIVLKALEGGPVIVDDIIWRLESLVRIKLEKLRVRGVVIRECRGGPHRKFTFRLLHPDRAAKALSEKGGGLSPAAKAAPEAQPPAQSDASIPGAARQRQRASLKRSGDHSRGRGKLEEK
jgi:hypothetical protein